MTEFKSSAIHPSPEGLGFLASKDKKKPAVMAGFLNP